MRMQRILCGLLLCAQAGVACRSPAAGAETASLAAGASESPNGEEEPRLSAQQIERAIAEKYAGVSGAILGFEYSALLHDYEEYVKQLAHSLQAKGKAKYVRIEEGETLLLGHGLPTGKTVFAICTVADGRVGVVSVPLEEIEKWPRYPELLWLREHKRPVNTNGDVIRRRSSP